MKQHGGLTLLEVILGLAIFVGSVATISSLVEIGVRASQYTQLMNRATMLAESKSAEVVAGFVLLEGFAGSTFLEDPAWQWQLSSSEGPVPGLKWVTISVFPSSTGELRGHRDRVQYTLNRLVIDPAYDFTLSESSLSGSFSSAPSTE